jgi:hypothetical protein
MTQCEFVHIYTRMHQPCVFLCVRMWMLLPNISNFQLCLVDICILVIPFLLDRNMQSLSLPA